MVKIYTAQYRYSGSNRLDITVKGKDDFGKVFAPTWGMVNTYKKKQNKELYMKQYLELMLDSYKNNFSAWQKILNMEEVVLVCFCKSGDFCHRLLLADYLRQLGAIYIAELGSDSIDSFKVPKYTWLSNFHKTPITYEGITYSSTEHMYQAYKATNKKDHMLIVNSKNPKKAGKQVELRKDWDQVKLFIMWQALLQKFSNPNLKQLLLSTGNCLIIEGNYWHDNFWGNCTCPKCNGFEGKNLLGKMLMTLRSNLR